MADVASLTGVAPSALSCPSSCGLSLACSSHFRLSGGGGTQVALWPSVALRKIETGHRAAGKRGRMANRSLTTYLNNHVAGSVMALELLEQLKDEGAGAKDGPVLATLHTEISADRQTLEDLMTEMGITTSLPQQASAWLTEKLSEVKLRLDDPEG